MDLLKLAEEIIAGSRLGSNDDLSFFIDCDLDSLCKGADMLRKHFIGDKVDLCSIASGKTGHCGENCKFCAQSVHNNTGCKVTGFANLDELMAGCKENADAGVDRFSIVTSGRSLTGEDFEKALAAYKSMHEKYNIELCASHGFLTREQMRRLIAVGVVGIHHNIETSPRYFKEVCTTHTFKMKIETIKMAQEEGLKVCSGGIIGMGENWQDRIDMALVLSELHVYSIPLNVLMPIPGTPFENIPRLSEDEILRTVAMFRYINPESEIRLAAGRAQMKNSGEKAFMAGASASITGNMLTTSGSTIFGDIKMLRGLGRVCGN